MIAFDYDEQGAVTRRRLRGVAVDELGRPGVLVVAHISKLDGLDISNAIDISTLDPDALTVPLWQLTVAGGTVAVNAEAPAPQRAAMPALDARQIAEIQGLINDELNRHGLAATTNSPPVDEPVS